MRIAGGLVFVCMGCFGANSYSTPRAVEPGKFVGTLGFDARTEGTPPLDERSSTVLVTPSFTGRVGVVDRVDLGVRVPPAVDVKVQAVRSPYFDLAFAPRYQLLKIPGMAQDAFDVRTIHAVDVPVLASVQDGKALALILGLGPMWTFESGRAPKTWALATCAVAMRITPGLALVPSVALVDRRDDRRLFFGLGLSIGALPRFE